MKNWKKLAKTEEVQALEANMRVLENQLDFERDQWTELQGKYKELIEPVLHTLPLERNFTYQCSLEEIGRTPQWTVSSTGINGGDQKGVGHYERSKAIEETRIYQRRWRIQQLRIERGHETI